jgi:hypothetical protein
MNTAIMHRPHAQKLGTLTPDLGSAILLVGEGGALKTRRTQGACGEASLALSRFAALRRIPPPLRVDTRQTGDL